MLLHVLTQATAARWLTTLLPISVQFVLFLRWLHRRMRTDKIVHACVRDIALNHLPHIYTSLQAISLKQGITLHELPITLRRPQHATPSLTWEFPSNS